MEFTTHVWLLAHVVGNTQNTSLAAPGALDHRLQRRTACNTSPPALSKMADGVSK